MLWGCSRFLQAPPRPPAALAAPPHLAWPHEKDLGLQHRSLPPAGPRNPPQRSATGAVVRVERNPLHGLAAFVSKATWVAAGADGSGRSPACGFGLRGPGVKTGSARLGRGYEESKNPLLGSPMTGRTSEPASPASLFVGSGRIAGT